MNISTNYGVTCRRCFWSNSLTKGHHDVRNKMDAKKTFIDEGWREGASGQWICPECIEGSEGEA